MIPRYEIPEVTKLWSDQVKYETFLEVEIAVVQAWEELADFVPKGTARKIKETVGVNCQRVDEIEAVTKHDVIAFCSMVTEQVPAEVGRWFHFGVTSSDIIDTATSLQLRRSIELVIPVLDNVLKALATRAKEYQDLPALGRSHGMAAEPTSFGQKLLGHYAEFARRKNDLVYFMNSGLTAQSSGAVGNYAILNPQIEKRVAEILNLRLEDVSTQVIPRDRIASLIHIGAQIANAIERLCVEIRHLHRSEVGEVHEGFAKGQKGSSTMPHKKNPVSGENLTGIARLIRSHVSIADENTILWHERDISHSSAERLMLPDHFGLMIYALKRLASTVNDLVVHEDVIRNRVASVDGFLSSYYLHHLLRHSDSTREELYAQVQTAAFTAKAPGEFKILLEKESGASLPDVPENLGRAHTKDVFFRVFETYPIP